MDRFLKQYKFNHYFIAIISSFISCITSHYVFNKPSNSI